MTLNQIFTSFSSLFSERVHISIRDKVYCMQLLPIIEKLASLHANPNGFEMNSLKKVVILDIRAVVTQMPQLES